MSYEFTKIDYKLINYLWNGSEFPSISHLFGELYLLLRPTLCYGSVQGQGTYGSLETKEN